jgi:hypothetical protein
MQQIRREREGVRTQLANVQTSLDAGREVFTRGLDMLSHPDTVYDTLTDDAAKGALVKAIFTKLHLDADEDRNVTVSAHELASPFDALVAAQAAWRWTTVEQAPATGTGGARTPTAALDSIRGRHPDGATASDDHLANLLASIFDERGSSKAKVVGDTGIEPVTSSV